MTPSSSSHVDFSRFPLLSKPLYAFSLPPELLDILTLRSLAGLPAPTDLDPNKNSDDDNDDDDQSRDSLSKPGDGSAAGGSLTCQTCLGTTFSTVQEQRSHFKSDWHRYNTRVTQSKTFSGGGRGAGKGLGVLTEVEFEEIDDDISSLSGSASDSSLDDADPISRPKVDKVTRLLQSQRLSGSSTPTSIVGGAENSSMADTGEEIDSDQEAEEKEYRRRAELRTAMIWFKAQKSEGTEVGEGEGARQGKIVPDDTQLGIYRALFPSNLNQPSTFLPALRSIQFPSSSPTPTDEPPADRIYTLLMVAGGHFAGMVVSLTPLDLLPAKGSGLKPEKQEVKGAGSVRVLKHKAFHRYTTRKKQGGEQGDNDNAKGKANSAGAMLRRYGAQSLREEIQALLIEWEDEVRASERIFIRTSAMGRKSFYGYPGAVLDKSDERIRVFPFPTRRPTQSELLRCFHELTKVKITHLSDQELQVLEEAYIASLQPKVNKALPSSIQLPAIKAPAAPKLSPEEEAYRDLRERMLDMIRKSRLEALEAFWAKHGERLGGVDARMEEWVEDGTRGLTVLMVASQAGQEGVVKWLLEEKRADPTLPVGMATIDQEEGKPDVDDTSMTVKSTGNKRTAYDLASSKEVRNTFRRLAFDHPEWHDWLVAGHVPSGLSEEKEQEQEKRKMDRRKGLKEKAKEREAKKASEAPVVEEVAAVPESPKSTSGPQKLGGSRPGGGENGLAGLTPEMRAKIERERRARAAEARLSGR